jgi:transcription antitermination factor NusG
VDDPDGDFRLPKPGDAVRITAGTFENMKGRLLNIIVGLRQARVELMIYSRPVVVEVDKANIERV